MHALGSNSVIEVGKILGYGEDAFTLWALKHRMSTILESLKDESTPSDCFAFYRPSFGRRGGQKNPEFGEFDAIIASTENIYLIEGKWDFLFPTKKEEIAVRKEQLLRHNILSWYIARWDKKYLGNWDYFAEENKRNFEKEFNGKPIALSDSLLAVNLEFILCFLQKHCRNFSCENNVKNVLLFFYNKKINSPPSKVPKNFSLVEIDYSQVAIGNYINIEYSVNVSEKPLFQSFSRDKTHAKQKKTSFRCKTSITTMLAHTKDLKARLQQKKQE